MGDNKRGSSWTVQLPLLGALETCTVDLPQAQSAYRPGVVYTKPWVAEFILDLAGYTVDKDLPRSIAVEPAVGEGAFLLPMIRRLIAACQQEGYPLPDCQQAIRAYDLDAQVVEGVRSTVTAILYSAGLNALEATELACVWVQHGDYLLAAPYLPPADFVLGNPPYIRLEDIPVAAVHYRQVYRTMKGRADLYVAFYEAALRQLKVGGVCAFICADRWMLNQYGGALREFVTTGYAVEAIINMHEADPFATQVNAYPAITVIRKSQQGQVLVASVTREAAGERATELAAAFRHAKVGHESAITARGLHLAAMETWSRGTAPWPNVAPERLALLRRLEEEFPPLESPDTGTSVSIGVATGLDDVFIVKEGPAIEPSRLLPLAMASDLRDGTLQWSGRYLIDPWDEGGLVDLERFPLLARYFEQHRDRLSARYVAKHNPREWYRTIDRVQPSLKGTPKLYFHDIKDRITPVLDRGETYPQHNLYFVQSTGWDLETLGGLLLSAVGQFFVECYGVRVRGGYLRFQAQYLRRIRVPHPEQIGEVQAALLRQAFRTHDADLATRTALDVYGIASLPTEGNNGY